MDVGKCIQHNAVTQSAWWSRNRAPGTATDATDDFPMVGAALSSVASRAVASQRRTVLSSDAEYRTGRDGCHVSTDTQPRCPCSDAKRCTDSRPGAAGAGRWARVAAASVTDVDTQHEQCTPSGAGAEAGSVAGSCAVEELTDADKGGGIVT